MVQLHFVDIWKVFYYCSTHAEPQPITQMNLVLWTRFSPVLLTMLWQQLHQVSGSNPFLGGDTPEPPSMKQRSPVNPHGLLSLLVHFSDGEVYLHQVLRDVALHSDEYIDEWWWCQDFQIFLENKIIIRFYDNINHLFWEFNYITINQSARYRISFSSQRIIHIHFFRSI